ncbi:hypothetical protein H696_05527 [Fonticula alba]|uniref:Uncharacterized protein n=1 Tax=Fonticula alba TaxID=691883 RepID=A0A058Z1D6_FONAL|nr:hypothetical protein H696_05527 [Fonticula alba]KCV68060.1 hypothetical protein H696_05527 [Fonticula alba]|eukprot:XP_009497627.1 hypothetical protein H696_05527 [Fonticula alba]
MTVDGSPQPAGDWRAFWLRDPGALEAEADGESVRSLLFESLDEWASGGEPRPAVAAAVDAATTGLLLLLERHGPAGRWAAALRLAAGAHEHDRRVGQLLRGLAAKPELAALEPELCRALAERRASAQDRDLRYNNFFSLCFPPNEDAEVGAWLVLDDRMARVLGQQLGHGEAGDPDEGEVHWATFARVLESVPEPGSFRALAPWPRDLRMFFAWEPEDERPGQGAPFPPAGWSLFPRAGGFVGRAIRLREAVRLCRALQPTFAQADALFRQVDGTFGWDWRRDAAGALAHVRLLGAVPADYRDLLVGVVAQAAGGWAGAEDPAQAEAPGAGGRARQLALTVGLMDWLGFGFGWEDVRSVVALGCAAGGVAAIRAEVALLVGLLRRGDPGAVDEPAAASSPVTGPASVAMPAAVAGTLFGEWLLGGGAPARVAAMVLPPGGAQEVHAAERRPRRE